MQRSKTIALTMTQRATESHLLVPLNNVKTQQKIPVKTEQQT